MKSKNSVVITTLLKALEHAPNPTPISLHLGGLYFEDEEYQTALECFQQVLESNPVHPDALEGALLCAEKLNNHALIETYQVIFSAIDTDEQSKKDSVSKPVPIPNDNHQSGSAEPQKLKLVSNDASPSIDNIIDIASKAEINLQDVAGLEHVKKRLDLSFLAPIRNPEMAKKYNIKVSSGLMLYGPPGCGKTYIARALAGEVNATFMSIGIDEILDMWVGSSERNLAAVYQEARAKAPAVIFFDEIDALGHKRSGVSSSAVQNTVNQLLMELDGIKSENDGVFTLGATNLPWKVDSALRRPGRFDRSIFVSPPDLLARKKLFEIYLKDRPTQSIDVDYFVQKTHLHSAADIRQICDFAAEICLEQAMLKGHEVQITNKILKTALKDTSSSILEWFNTAKNFVTFSNSGSTYDDVSDYMKANKLL